MARRALILANGSFEDSRIATLASPVPDAKRLAELLQKEEVGGYDVVVGNDMGAQKMRLAVEQFFRSATKSDFLLLFLSGHGFKDSEGNLVFAASDTDKDWLESTGVPARFINKQASKTRASLSVFLIDSCYSGAFTKGHVFKKGDAGVDREDFSILDGHGTAIITASSSVQLAGEAEADGSVQSHFTRHFIEGIETGKADRGGKGHITLDDLFVYVRDGLKQSAPGQTPKPHYFGLDGSEEVARNPVWKPVTLPDELFAEVRHPDRKVRGSAAESLAEIARQGDEKAPLARIQLEKLCSDDSIFVRNLAKELLQGLVDADAKAEALRVQKEERAEQARERARLAAEAVAEIEKQRADEARRLEDKQAKAKADEAQRLADEELRAKAKVAAEAKAAADEEVRLAEVARFAEIEKQEQALRDLQEVERIRLVDEAAARRRRFLITLRRIWLGNRNAIIVAAIIGLAFALWLSWQKPRQTNLVNPPIKLGSVNQPANAAQNQKLEPKLVIDQAVASAYSGFWRLEQQTSPLDCSRKSDYTLSVRIGTDGQGSLNGEAPSAANALPQGGIEIGEAFLRVENGKLLIVAAHELLEKPSVFVRCNK